MMMESDLDADEELLLKSLWLPAQDTRKATTVSKDKICEAYRPTELGDIRSAEQALRILDEAGQVIDRLEKWGLIEVETNTPKVLCFRLTVKGYRLGRILREKDAKKSLCGVGRPMVGQERPSSCGTALDCLVF